MLAERCINFFIYVYIKCYIYVVIMMLLLTDVADVQRLLDVLTLNMRVICRKKQSF